MTTIFQDAFAGSGSIVGHTPDTTFGGLVWEAGPYTPLTLSGGYATAVGGTRGAEINSAETDYSQPREFVVDFVFKTGATVVDSAFNSVLVSSGGIYAYFHINLDSALMDPDTEYPGKIEFYEDAQFITFMGIRTFSSDPFTVGTGILKISLYLSEDSSIGDLAISTVAMGSATYVYHVVSTGEARSNTALYDLGADSSPAVTFPVGTFFGDNFSRTGPLDEVAPPVNFAGLKWQDDGYGNELPDLAKGFAKDSDHYSRVAVYGDGVTDYSAPLSCTVGFSITTPPTGANNGLRVVAKVGGHEFGFTLDTSDAGTTWYMHDQDGDNETLVSLTPNTVYDGTITISDGFQQIEFMGATITMNIDYVDSIGFNKLDIKVDGFKMNYIYAYEGIGEAIDPNVLVSSGVLSDSFLCTVKSNLESSGVVSSSVFSTLYAINDIVVSGIVRGYPLPSSYYDLVSSGIVSDSFTSRVDANTKNSGIVSGSAYGTRYAVDYLVSSGVLRSSINYVNSSDMLVSSGIASSSINGLRKAHDDIVVHGIVGDEITPYFRPVNLLRSSGILSSIITQHLRANEYLRSSGIVRGRTLYDALQEAWVMNAQTHAMSRYNGLLYKSVAMIGDRVIALGDTGFFELDAKDDESVPVASKAITGMIRLGSDKLKRLGYINLGYTTDKPVSFVVQEYGDYKIACTYQLPSRTANAPRTGRVKLGGGLRSQYYQFTIMGQSLNLDYAEVEVFESENRKV